MGLGGGGGASTAKLQHAEARAAEEAARAQRAEEEARKAREEAEEAPARAKQELEDEAERIRSDAAAAAAASKKAAAEEAEKMRMKAAAEGEKAKQELERIRSDAAAAAAASKKAAAEEAEKMRMKAAAEGEKAKQELERIRSDAAAAAAASKKAAAEEAEKMRMKAAAEGEKARSVLGRFGLLSALDEQRGAAEDVSVLQRAVYAGDVHGAATFLKNRSKGAPSLAAVQLASSDAKEEVPVVRAPALWYDSSSSSHEVKTAACHVLIAGVGSGLEGLNGRYSLVPGETSGGRPVYKKDDGTDRWIEYSPNEKWMVKAKAHKGTETGSVSCRETCEKTRAVEEVSCGWKAYNGTSEKWEVQEGAAVVVWSSPVKITGVGSGLEGLNGTYVQVEDETSGGRPVYKKDDGTDRWIEYSPNEKWMVKAKAHKGTETGSVSCRETCEKTRAVEEVSCGWKAYNGTSEKWEVQEGAAVVGPAGSATRQVQLPTSLAPYLRPATQRPLHPSSTPHDLILSFNSEAGGGQPLHPASTPVHPRDGSLLHLAAGAGAKGMCSLLLDHCRELEACVDSRGRTARQVAEEGGHTQVVQEMDARSARVRSLQQDETDLREAARSGNVDRLLPMLRRGVDLFLQDDKGNTALHLAAAEGHVIPVSHLLSCEQLCAAPARALERISTRNKRGKTAMDLAVFFEYTEVVEEIERNKEKMLGMLQEQQAALKAEAERKVKVRDEEFARLQAALEQVEDMVADYRASYSAAQHILDPELYELLALKVLCRDPGSAGASEISVRRFTALAKKFVCGEFADAANGLPELLQVADAVLMEKINAGMPAVKEEIEAFGNEEVKADFRYVVEEACSEKQYPNGVRDKGRDGMRFADFMEHPHVKEAKLSECEVVALRMYTLPVFQYINDPLRDLERIRSNIAHPLPLLAEHLSRALKKLRRINAGHASATESMVFWRGMKNLEVTELFSTHGGTELAPMSTTSSLGTAIDYSMSERSLIFCIQTKNKLQRGVDLEWISAFPNESETLFPPLTYLQPTGRTQVVEVGGMHFTFVEVHPTIA